MGDGLYVLGAVPLSAAGYVGIGLLSIGVLDLIVALVSWRGDMRHMLSVEREKVVLAGIIMAIIAGGLLVAVNLTRDPGPSEIVDCARESGIRASVLEIAAASSDETTLTVAWDSEQLWSYSDLLVVECGRELPVHLRERLKWVARPEGHSVRLGTKRH